MFCTNCGHQLPDGTSFCPNCGTQVGSTGNTVSQNNNHSDFNEGPDFASYRNESDGLNWKDGLNASNVERFAPIAAMIPLVMVVVIPVLRILLSSIITMPFRMLGLWWPAYRLPVIALLLMKLVFLLVAAGATVSLVQLILKSKDTSNPAVWIAPAGTFLATLSCIGFLLPNGRMLALIPGILSVLMGVEFLARFAIAEQPLESAFNPGAAFKVYKMAYDDYRTKYPTTKDLERANYVDPEKSYFDGSGLELFGYIILTIIVCAVTCGIATPWMIAKICRWRISHTVINENRLTFTGSGASLLGHWILWEILTIVTCGIFGLFLYVRIRNWELKHTFIDGMPIIANSNVSYFDGTTLQYIGYSLLSGLLILLTCGLAFPWVMVMIQKWDTKHQIINNRRLAFSGSGLGFLGEFLIIAILSLITCGIYSCWGIVRMNKYIIRNTDFVDYGAYTYEY